MASDLEASAELNLGEAALERCFAEHGFAKPDRLLLTCLSATDSTNEEIKKAIAAHKQEGTVYTALEQRGGYGRQGRLWSSPLGGLYLSLLLRPCEHGRTVSQLPTLSHAVSIAVRRTLLSFGLTQNVLIKWPNDLVCEQGKLSGISLEVIEDAVCVGIGINIFHAPEPLLPAGKHRPAYVANVLENKNIESSVSAQGLTRAQLTYREDVMVVLLNEVFSVYNQWLDKGFFPFRDEYRAQSSLQGQFVQLVSLTNDILYEGVVCDVDADGYLCLMKEDGSLIHAHSGEVHVK